MRILKLGILFFFVSFILFAYKENKNATEIKFSDDNIVRFYDYQKEISEISDSLNIIGLTNGQKSQLRKRLEKLKLNGSVVRKKYENTVLTLKNKVLHLTGEVYLTYNKTLYEGIIVDLKKQLIQMHWKSKDGVPYKSLGDVKKTVSQSANKILMLTNGGMYLQNNVPQGLYIENKKELRPIDTSTNKFGNFYLQPNGIFYITSSKATILSTDKFLSQNKNDTILFATQSGPMLVEGGEINHHFKHKSQNYNIRSGVGIMQDSRAIFIISASDRTNFHDFASIFKNVFGCDESLYLDGAISKMHLKNMKPNEVDGDFGVIISVLEK